MMSLLRKSVIASAFALLLFPSASPAAQPKEPAKAAAPSGGEEVIARINGKEITMDHLETATANLLPMLTYHSSVSDEKFKEIQAKAFENLINNELIYKYAKDNKLDKADKKEIDKEVENLKKNLPKGETMEKVLKRSKMTMNDLREEFKRDIVIDAVTKAKSQETRKKAADAVTEAYMKEYYQKNLAKFKEPEQIHLRSILIKADPSGGQRVWNEARKKAEDLAKQARTGADFSKLAEKNSGDPFASKGGDMGWAHKGSLFPEIEEAVSNMKPGDVSQPVMTIYGYHIVKLEGRKPSVQKKFEELNQQKLKGELEQKEYKKLWSAWLKGLRDSSKVEIVKPL